MEKYVMRPMTVRELRLFLDRFPHDIPVRFFDFGSLLVDEILLDCTVEEYLESVAHCQDDEDVLIQTRLGIFIVYGFRATFPPTLICSMGSGSVEMN